MLNPLVEESLDRSISQQNRLSCIVTPIKAKTRKSPASPSSESRQSRALSRFTKELERYCVAASTNGKVSLAPSTPAVSESPTTLDTVTELLPYHKQFKAAGLAVTSREQIPRIPEAAYSQLPATHAGRVRGAKAAVMQVDGSTVTPSEQASAAQEPAAPAVFVKKDASSSDFRPIAQASQPPRPVTKSLLPSILKKNPSLAYTAHSSRKFSKDHIHPSQATPAGPLVTPLGLMDLYFDSPQHTKPQHEQPNERNTSMPSAVPSTVSLPIDKPLPEYPQVKRRPIPPRSERRHMENTAEWPTAGVLIHDKASPPNRDEPAGTLHDEPARVKDSISIQSWTTVEDGLPDEPQWSPPVPPKDINETMSASVTAEDKPGTLSKDGPSKNTETRQRHRCHPGHSLYKRWIKATCMRHRAAHESLPMPTTMREELETPAEDSEKPQQAESGPNDAVPQLPVNLPPLVETSSFEKALDAVISKLDAMEGRRRYDRWMDLEAARQALAKAEAPVRATSKVASPKPSSALEVELPASTTALEATSSLEEAIKPSDKDINDRDVLLGLKMAICAACDEDLDDWICTKTGLRLRRFLADLKAFDSVPRDQKPSQPISMSRRIRRNEKGKRWLQAEQKRRERNSRPWSPCFGADGQDSLVEPGGEAWYHAIAE